MELSLTILLTGFVVVFAVLLVLIGIIKLYGTIIYNLQNKKQKKSVKEKVVVERDAVAVSPEPIPSAVIDAAPDQNDDELIAVIAAAVYAVYSPDRVRIRSIRRESKGASAWRTAGLRDNTRVF